MEILQRAKGHSGEIVSPFMSEKDVKEEVDRRTAKAGFTTRDGMPAGRTKIMNEAPTEAYRRNYEKIAW